MKAEFCEKLKPVGVVLIDIEHTRNADRAAGGFVFGKGLPVKQERAFFIDEVLSVFALDTL